MWKWAIAIDMALLAVLYQLMMLRFRSLPPTIPWSMADVAALMTRAAVALALMNVGVAVCIAGMRRQDDSSEVVIATLVGSMFIISIALAMFFFMVLLPVASQY